ncbi:MAG: hypothetical protein JOZ90_10900 [Alphaproteobacteria bacterium]|nr:hypothetical protein [Alphaproteobacteria bacterium]MBV9371033.1 hypothetical protein [Alphaproteobacteria bacterium]MBV9901593.1 hypothetical protein [Alphaproteobacteria bacterium]
MNNENIAARRDEVLFEFHRQCQRPTAEQIVDWTERYPEFADEIREHAAARLDWIAMERLPAMEPDEALIARGRSRALNAIHNAQAAARAQSDEGAATFQALMQGADTSVPGLARELDIDRGIVADMMAGRMLPPLGRRFMDGLTGALRTSVAAIEAALHRASQAPRLGHAKATRAPKIIQRSYADIVRSSGMSDERKRYWLDKD